jgi:hypothetical protein
LFRRTAEWPKWNISLRLAVAPAWPPPRAFQPRPPLPIYAHIMLARPRTLPTGFGAPCLPTKTDKLPSGGLWLDEIKHDGFRIIGLAIGTPRAGADGQGGGHHLPGASRLHSLRWFVSLCRVILDAAIGHMPMVRAEVPIGGPNGASARSKIPILLVWPGPCAELF